MKRIFAVLFIVFFVLVAFGGCKQSTGAGNTTTSNAATSNPASNKVAVNNASKVTQATDDLNKTLNDLKLEDDTASVNDQDYANSFQSTIDDFQKVLSSDTDTVNVN